MIFTTWYKLATCRKCSYHCHIWWFIESLSNHVSILRPRSEAVRGQKRFEAVRRGPRKVESGKSVVFLLGNGSERVKLAKGNVTLVSRILISQLLLHWFLNSRFFADLCTNKSYWNLIGLQQSNFMSQPRGVSRSQS